MRNKKTGRGIYFRIYFLFLISYFLFVFSCGYHMVGSKPLPFNSVTIKQIHNRTYEPRLEERLHNAISKEFISQGIKVISANGDISIDATVTTFELGAIAIIDEEVQEQSITMKVDVRIIDNEQIIEFPSMESPIKITFQSTGTVSDSVMHKEKAIKKACEEIAREIIGKIIIRYVK